MGGASCADLLLVFKHITGARHSLRIPHLRGCLIRRGCSPDSTYIYIILPAPPGTHWGQQMGMHPDVMNCVANMPQIRTILVEGYGDHPVCRIPPGCIGLPQYN